MNTLSLRINIRYDNERRRRTFWIEKDDGGGGGCRGTDDDLFSFVFFLFLCVIHKRVLLLLLLFSLGFHIVCVVCPPLFCSASFTCLCRATVGEIKYPRPYIFFLLISLLFFFSSSFLLLLLFLSSSFLNAFSEWCRHDTDTTSFARDACTYI